MSDDVTNISHLKEKIKDFCTARDWDQFHDAKELAIALSIEASELLEHFRWIGREEVNSKFDVPEKREEIEDELADILTFVLRIAQMYDIDLSKSFDRKLGKNNEKYSVDKCKGLCKKYTELE
jgi:NTP pyrophosphatase (non-canonical NTP hydrolase)